MLVRDAGGEFALIKKILSAAGGGKGVVLPNGDDAAVLQVADGNLVATVDTVVEGRHFDLRYFTPEQIGMRAIEGAASDVVAVGGVPRFVLCALILTERTTVEQVEAIYRGIARSLKRVGAVLVGGDTSSGVEQLTLSVTVLGEISARGKILTRRGAKPGDLIMVSGPLGGSAAGLELCKQGYPGFEEVKRYHLEPLCRIDVGQSIAAVASAAIDISDGLSSEIHHICRASGCGAVIDFDKLVAKPGVLEAASALKADAREWMVNGGEEFEILFTVPKELAANAPGIAIGEIAKGSEVHLRRGSVTEALAARGFAHLAK